MRKAVFPGSFDPPTLGHLNIIERAGSLFEELVVVIAENPQKKYLFSAAERVALMQELVKDRGNISVCSWNSLMVDFMRQQDIRIILRGVRGTDDFSYEFEISMINKALDPHIETLFMTTDPRYFVLRASAVKEIAFFQGDISSMVPPQVEAALRLKFPHALESRQRV
ncbi:MAG: pantetheine-phosphate adenylyltransferase [Spirochaetaceae bacterium]|jgi:pantetheine-phosphate adenylyltransferase|nr:pantetheine-phosphate adenylyltransferase [Spirochaetaceae bacterium]